MRIAPTSPAKAPHTPAQAHHPAPASRPAKSFTTVFDEGSALGTQPPAAASASRPQPPSPARVPGKPMPTPTSNPVRAMLTRAVGAERQVDALLEAAARGKTFTPAQLLAMQATVARYAQTVEVVSRVADRLVGAIKQTMGTQV
jgi:hypothetical protein